MWRHVQYASQTPKPKFCRHACSVPTYSIQPKKFLVKNFTHKAHRPNRGIFFSGSMSFMKFPTTLVQVAEHPPPPPPPPHKPSNPNRSNRGIFFSGSMHFVKFPATLVQVAEKPPTPPPPPPPSAIRGIFAKKNNKN